MLHLHTSWKRPKTGPFVTFSEGIEIEHLFELIQDCRKIFFLKQKLTDSLNFLGKM